MEIDGLSIGSNSKDIVPPQWEKCLTEKEPSRVFQRLGVTIRSLPDNVLLDIFDFYQVLINKDFINEHPWNWEKLVHVCRRWRYIIFESPVRLNLQLFCTEKSPVRKLLDVWPPFPLVIRFNDHSDFEWDENSEDTINSTDNLIAALERRDRVREIQVGFVIPLDHLRVRVLTVMEEPFPALRYLEFESVGDNIQIIPPTFLDGSAPCLRDLTLRGISFPSLPRLLSSTRDLTSLHLIDLFDSWYIPPETMATSLSALPKLEFLSIMFKSWIPLERRNRAPQVQTRFVLPALTFLRFQGVGEYLEVLAARLDAPLLDRFKIIFFHQPVFDIPQTVRFFCHLDSFSPSSLTLIFHLWDISFQSNTTHHSAVPPLHSWTIMSQDPDYQVHSVAQICGQILPFRSSVKSLTIKCNRDTPIDHRDPTIWFHLFHTFPCVQSLQIPVHLEPFIASVLGRPTEESLAASEVFPSLHSLSIVGKMLGETMQYPIQSFIADRQRSSRPVTVSRILELD